ncbi:unnamed protein product [Phytophthora fragariaefolia]|uniref:Unnamed protein product n=1 Tax=Phytophthora fragariaefolia TaxID=1490495 RepID=A0A9W6XWP9_9STRA|nr:unnamed protein product [Phytophthora fragariaefolia]
MLRELVRVRAAGDAPRCFASLASQTWDKSRRTRVRDPLTWQHAARPALLAFLQQEKHLLVPTAFVVPSGDAWPRAAWGYPLGRHVQWLRKQRRDGGYISETQLQELDEMQFAWDPTQQRWDRFVLPALRTFFALNGHTDVPLDFRVPDGGAEWPDHLWGQRLGNHVANIRRRGDFATQVEADAEELKRLGFSRDSTLASRRWHERVVPALRVFRQEFGHCNVSTAFTVPSSPPWPAVTWGMRLGDTVQKIRRGEVVNQDERELKDLGFVWEHSSWEWSQRIMPALDTFQRLKGHCRVPHSFAVPSDANWPTHSWGLNLGFVVSKIRNQGRYSAHVFRDRKRLQELGFVWDINRAEWSERIMPALETFHQLNGHCRVPSSFVVPSNDNWPALSWGLKLGLILIRIRSQGHYSAQVFRNRSRLEELGYVWNFSDSEWSERILPAVETFHRIHGHCRVPRPFVVPSEAEWPTEVHGLKLGVAVNNIRSHSTYFDQVVRAMDSLEAIKFDSRIPAPRWRERVEPMLATFEQLHGHREVPRDFVVPSSFPWEAKDFGIQLGRLQRKAPRRARSSALMVHAAATVRQ